jgi:hypothetical protein
MLDRLYLGPFMFASLPFTLCRLAIREIPPSTLRPHPHPSIRHPPAAEDVHHSAHDAYDDMTHAGRKAGIK